MYTFLSKTQHLVPDTNQVYDSDGNFLQALDTLEMQTMLPSFLRVVSSYFQPDDAPTMKLVDLGCGTGRNTMQLFLTAPKNVDIIGLDASPGMLDVARRNLRKVGIASGHSDDEDNNCSANQDDQFEVTSPREINMVSLNLFNILSWPRMLFPRSCYASTSTSSIATAPGDDIDISTTDTEVGVAGVISTLVVEHIPLDLFFQCVSALLLPGGYLLLTNMHSEMGEISQAGFIDEATGTKIRPETSYCHRIADVLSVAERTGLEVIGDVRERTVDETLVEVLGRRARKWVGVKVWFGVLFRKKTSVS